MILKKIGAVNGSSKMDLIRRLWFFATCNAFTSCDDMFKLVVDRFFLEMIGYLNRFARQMFWKADCKFDDSLRISHCWSWKGSRHTDLEFTAREA